MIAATVPRPGILLMDEPFSGLDVRLRASVRGETLAILRETGATAIIVTHDPREAMLMSSRIILMRGGKIAQDSDAESLYLRPGSLFAARFFGALNEFVGPVKDKKVETPLGPVPAAEMAENSQAVVAIRPQGLAIEPANHANHSGSGSPGTVGRVMSRRFLGEYNHYQVAVEGQNTYLMVEDRAPDRYAPGDEVQVRLDQVSAMVFAADSA
ncbi:MAG: TOBE domain-containing protein [Alphaproteobacteria bacterium]